ncbi:MAG: hypothetical protein HYV92_05175 [Candidatus Rokubacteria bacterium]|nr:hypothetical protein [Candidatus Rokubacteria bacterium]MBI2553814.1 hypothetical protein [Candidatus Rokubacteria bacterium]
MDLKRRGTSLTEIRRAIDAKYSKFGPGTPTPQPRR